MTRSTRSIFRRQETEGWSGRLSRTCGTPWRTRGRSRQHDHEIRPHDRDRRAREELGPDTGRGGGPARRDAAAPQRPLARTNSEFQPRRAGRSRGEGRIEGVSISRRERGLLLLRGAGKVSPKATDEVRKAGLLDRKFTAAFVQASRVAAAAHTPSGAARHLPQQSWGRCSRCDARYEQWRPRAGVRSDEEVRRSGGPRCADAPIGSEGLCGAEGRGFGDFGRRQIELFISPRRNPAAPRIRSQTPRTRLR